MTIFVDASALIAMIAGEEDANSLAALLEADPARICSAVSMWETVAGLCRSYRFAVPDARLQAGRFLEAGGIGFVGIGALEWEAAMDAYARFGRGRHLAALNMGDCFAYACAKTNGARLLYKGDDFARTDMA